jgi:hypothetical protein
MLLLRYSVLPRLNYLMRTLDPKVGHEAYSKFDALVLDVATTVLSSPELSNDDILPLFHLPIREGGCGFRPTATTALPPPSLLLPHICYAGKIVSAAHRYRTFRSDLPCRMHLQPQLH